MKMSTNNWLSIASLLLLVAALVLAVMTFVANTKLVNQTNDVSKRVDIIDQSVTDLKGSVDGGAITSVTILREIPKLGDLYTAYSRVSNKNFDQSQLLEDLRTRAELVVETLPMGAEFVGTIPDDICQVVASGPCGLETEVWYYETDEFFYLVQKRGVSVDTYGPFVGAKEDIVRDIGILNDYKKFLER
ncbi:hypothetical protein COY25_01970 [Candidatus Uhrbacteria bacterium CG_4_10_14_0_2_um_filter_41_7]|uniref:Uncharacterized protein n=1 Tax=Candidatus Uhrbacteria bacterium CG_4_9_14_3_um_filter_41_35 TaxID=1975034 RepID=A0A2M7XFV7_9BACT|nr:MAG: hypothetical protein COV92_02900 [Candidatus Uhrbacteria bacterium CG11_big_fil_rev_8_21_14_0_20_41_9]PIZ54593.1 MAG: hypothetical protein COY25_01970 [Candidatus Uhrbacteria bacterium CG_4_10_14_0_2_um_filter_41_7]PJA46754.1 MAG: hypothetical protein CO173_01525 [Candidatus Uhrbacteria bacterium CG_4_9_14_3_um_filter_41_35]